MRFRTRLVVAITATTFVTLAGAFAAVSYAVNRSNEHQLDDALSAEAHEEAYEASQLGGTELAISDRPGPFANDLGPLTKYGVIFAADGTVLASTPTFDAPTCHVPPFASIRRTAGVPFDTWCGREHLRAILVPVPSHKNTVLLLAAPRTDLDGDAAFLWHAVLTALGISIAWSLAVSTWLVRRLTRDHRRIASIARLVVAGDLSARVHTQTVDSEMAQLARDIDTMIEHLASLVTLQQRFVANAAHELQTPVTTLYTDLQQALRKPRDRDGYRAAIGEALEDTRRLKHLVQELLLFLKASKEHRPPTLFAARELVQGALDAVSRLTTEHGVVISVHADDVMIEGQRDSLERMLRNLLENAIRHSPVGGDVRVRVADVDGGVRIAVVDHGAGVSEEDRPRLFEAFYRNPRSRAIAPEGAGLGLGIAREIARAHGGDVLLGPASHERGAEFVVELPRPSSAGLSGS
ncbi:Osmosensitive K+ channel histidine kinase KdpD [Labilithrix luteola]|uniref:histidine kinase n=1 Tax=Labilithrix luteola TaxID=1391654 RepID=A0A0K1PTX7_9BACT|nr:HAMP domain-containing sensor histidine kinase [Labilithrix luteola]AKU96972.1 Osmosensitive K+ channel histidine kinase KdpD [Labilithrix luteola]